MAAGQGISKKQANDMAKHFGLNMDVVNADEWHYGLNVELEHGSVNPITNVTKNNLLKTAKIALAHLIEFPDYYKRLKRMEDQAKKYWKGRQRGKLFL